MAIDNREYAEALGACLLKLEQIKTFQKDKICSAIEPVCPVVRVAKVQVDYFLTPKDEADHNGTVDVFYENGPVDTTQPFVAREVTDGGTTTICTISRRADMEPWDAEDLEKIRVLQKTFYGFTGRMRLLDLIDMFTYNDMQLKIRNMPYVMKTMGKAIAQKTVQDYGYCYFNLKNFSLVNARVGRNQATELMKEYVHRLRDKLTEPSVIGRIGGDNFVVMFLRKDKEIVSEHLHGQPLVFNRETGERLNLSAVAGYYLPAEEDAIYRPEDIMDRISSALMIAKRKSLSEIVFSEAMEKQRIEDKRIESSFPEAIRKKEFQVYYQPKIELHDYHLVGAEALCRWVSDGKVISPGAFIPVLERGAGICQLDFYMLENVCMDIRRWMDQGKEPVRISFNLSRRHLGDLDLVKHILEIIDKYQVPHECIEVELTETTTEVEFDNLKKIVKQLQEAGIATSVDDFGTGYSSINLIREVPWNVLKLDKCFLPKVKEDQDYDSTMLRHVIAMAQDMGLECIVEGVETEEHVKLLQDCDCFMAQGFFFDRPMPVADFEQRLAHKNDSFWPKKDC
ncbi:MAG: GGDEF domain-containing protein [Lachnospiraceae bacterium]|nr:GGDEF domain-containing protein [Lachnospiraceae bacterium]